jgi:predicted transcriptional regulator
LRIRVPDAELAVLRVLWEGGPAPIRPITEALYPDGGAAAHATVQKLLERLESRGCVTRSREGRANVWAAAVGREDLIRDHLRDAVEKLGEGSWTPILSQLVHADVRPEDVDALRALVERLESGRDARPGRK